jgi:hypothetical protein
MEPRSDLALMELQARTLFVLDEAGRLVRVNERNQPCPRLFVGRTAEGDTIHLRHDSPPPLAAAVEAAVRTLPPWEAGRATPGAVERLASVLETGAVVERAHAGPAYVFPGVLFPSTGAMRLYPANAVLLHPALATWGPDLAECRPAFAVFRDRAAVAICASARSTAEAAEAGVETAPDYRGQGCAGLAVEAWAAAIRAEGRVPFYSTSWANTPSQAVARKLELRQFGEDIHLG